MNRLYKFFTLLFLTLLLTSILYGTIISWVTYQVIRSNAFQMMTNTSFGIFFQLGLVQGILYASVLLLMIIGLFSRSLKYGQKFTINKIISVALWFYLLTTVAYILHYISMSGGLNMNMVFLLGGPQVFLSSGIWVPFAIAWAILYFALLTRIKKPE